MSSSDVTTQQAAAVSEIINLGASFKFSDLVTGLTGLSKVVNDNSGKDLFTFIKDTAANGESLDPRTLLTEEQIKEQEANGVDFDALTKQLNAVQENAKSQGTKLVEKLAAAQEQEQTEVGPGNLGRAQTMKLGEELEDVDFAKQFEKKMALLLNNPTGTDNVNVEDALKSLSLADNTETIEKIAPELEAAIKANPDGLLAASQKTVAKLASAAEKAFVSTDSAKAEAALATFIASSDDFVAKHAAGKLADWSIVDFVLTFPVLTDASQELGGLQAAVVGNATAIAPGPVQMVTNLIAAIASPELAAQALGAAPVISIDQYKTSAAAYIAEYKKITSI